MRDRPIVLTGASGGVGVALTEYLLANGFTRLALQYNTRSDELRATVERHGLDSEVHCFEADLSDQDVVQTFGEKVDRTFGTPWGVINLAGSTSNGLSWKLSLEEFQRVLASNLTTTFLVCREFIPAMREQEGGRIVNTSSIVAFSGVAGTAHYAAAKAGVVGFTRALSSELAGRQITANVMALGYFDYGMIYTVPAELREEVRRQIPVRRFGLAAEIGGTISHLLSDEGAYTTGQVLHLNGGMHG